MRTRSRLEAIALILLRTLIGWHFLYEGYYKLVTPGWTRAGAPVGAWSASGYLRAATGPFAGTFHALAQSSMAGWVDHIVPIGLVLVGLSLVLGLYTQLGLLGALGFLTLFYVSAIPTDGAPRPGQEGTYLFVSKNLIEWAAALLLLACRTGDIAGLDLLRRRRGEPARA
jgi:thiosulfate dehydrogenase [quinone] large subunit